MKNIRFIARLDVKGEYLVKGIQLEGLRKLGNSLLGCDCSYSQTGLKHFNKPEEMQINRYGVMDAIIEMLQSYMNAYIKIKQYVENKGVKIYSATRGGYLEVFERVNFDRLFEEKGEEIKNAI